MSNEIEIFGVLDYDDYHQQLVDLVADTFDNSGIPYKLLYLPTAPLPGPPNDPSKLLVVIMPEITVDIDLGFDRINVMFEHWKHFPNPVLILSAVEHAERDYTLPDRVKFIHIGSDFLFQMNEYPKIQAQTTKNKNADKFWISLNQTPRLHNSISACYLLGNDLGRIVGPPNGLLKISNYNVKKYQTWNQFYNTCDFTTTVTDRQYKILQKGFSLLSEGIHFESEHNQITPNSNDHAGHFDLALRQLYSNSIVEIVNETVFFVKGIHVTEKFLNSVYGFNLPIILAAPGTVQYLRDSGFDMFDDVIDHSYDDVTDNIQRIFSAIDLNKRLLSDRTYAYDAWQRCQLRLEHNYQHAKTNMYNHFIGNLKLSLSEYISKFPYNLDR